MASFRRDDDGDEAEKRAMLYFSYFSVKKPRVAPSAVDTSDGTTTFTPSGGVSGMRLHGSLNFVNKQHGYCVYCGNQVT